LRLHQWERPDLPLRKSLDQLRKEMNLMVSFPDETQIRNFEKIIIMAAEADAKGMSEQEIWAELRREFPKKSG
jgi:hypothetical protein